MVINVDTVNTEITVKLEKAKTVAKARVITSLITFVSLPA